MSTHNHLTTTMAEGEAATNGDHGIDVWEVRQTLFSNSTKRRAAELNSIRDKLVDGGKSYRSFT